MVVEHHRPHLSYRVIYALYTTVSIGMVGAHSRSISTEELVDGVRELIMGRVDKQTQREMTWFN